MARQNLWPTPDAHMGSGGRTSKEAPTGKRQNGQKQQITLNNAVKWWPTPTAGDAESSGSRNTAQSKAHYGLSLTDAVRGDRGTGRMWATPMARDHKSGRQQPRLERRGETNGENLTQQVGGTLNPEFVEWLMGFPVGWTALEPSEMPPSRKTSRSSARRS